jgi:hypothetical protein
LQIRGHIDRCDARGFDGWILDRDHPETKLQLAIHCGPTVLGTCVADHFRKDLAGGGLAGGHCAFKFDFPDGLSRTELYELSIAVVGTEYFFPFRVGRPIMGLTAQALYERTAIDLHRSGRQWRKFANCILHIGTEKTGSTSLQTSLSLNRPIFANGGYYIPRSLASPLDDTALNHSQLAMISMYDENFQDDLRIQTQVFDRDGLNRARRNLFTRFSEEVSATPATCHTIILSNEHCHSRLATSDEVQNLKDFLDFFCETYQIVLYLRPQHELAMSQYGMFVANGTYDIDMFPPLPPPTDYGKEVYTNRAYFDYRALLERWSHVFGEAAMHPRIYAADSLRNGDVVSDFTAKLSVISEDLVAPPRRNANASACGQAFLIDFYRSFGDTAQCGAAMLRERVRNAVLARFPGTGRTPARAEVKTFLDRFAVSNEAVRSRWFPQRQRLFDVDLQKYPEIAPPVALDVKELVDIFVKVLLHDQERSFGLTPEGSERMARGLRPSCE